MSLGQKTEDLLLKNQRNKPKTIEIRKKRDFLLDCNSQNVKLPHYNALHDKNLSSFLQNFVIKQHLLKMKLMNEKGNYYSEKEYSILMKESEKPLKTELPDIENLKKSKFIIKAHNYKIPKLPKIMKRHKDNSDYRSKNHTIATLNDQSLVKPISKDEFKSFISNYKKEIKS